jgi:N-acetylneuraminic acid mutarotase
MKVPAIFRLFVFLLTLSVIPACQGEKFTDKGIPEVDITGVTVLKEGGAVFEGVILSTGSAEIREHGFLWDTLENPVAGTSGLALSESSIGEGSFSIKVNAGIKKDKRYFARAFIKTDNFISYSKIITFIGAGSLPCELVSVVPDASICGDTAIIKGKNFSFNPAGNIVSFGNVTAQVISADPDELMVKVPPAEGVSVRISVSVAGLKSVNQLDFTIKQPVLTDFFPLEGTFNDIISLKGSQFCIDPDYIHVYFNDILAEVVEYSRTEYKVKVPPQNIVSPAVVKIRYFNSYSYNELFSLKQAVINDVSPAYGKPGDIIVIYGENFNPYLMKNKVEIAGKEAYIVSCSGTEMHVKLPGITSPGSYPLTITTIKDSPVTWTGTIEMVTTWKRLNDFPGTARSSPAVFAIGDKGYMGTGHNEAELNDFWEYSPATDSWRRIKDFPIARLDFATGFAVDDMGYVTMGKVDETYSTALTRYNPADDTWETMTPKPGNGSSMKAPAFVINGKAYVPAAEEMYAYDPATNTWAEKSYPSELGYFGSGTAFAIGSRGYMGIGWIHQQSLLTSGVFEYDPGSNKWTMLPSFPGRLRSNAVFFSLPNGKAYVGLGTTLDNEYLKDLWEFDPATLIWTRQEDFPGTARYSAVAFTIGDKAYVGLGYDGTFCSDIWEFDPER